jgi:formiminotetrahydrofolate cyclodeaminase
MTELHQGKVSDLFARARDEATPGGGAITILGGYLGVSLILKALRVSARKDPAAGELVEAMAQLDALAPTLAGLADRDSASFQAYLDAAKLPKAAPEQADVRRKALVGAAEIAALAAIDAFELGHRLIALTNGVKARVSAVIMADITAGVGLLQVMCAVARENAEANLPGISDPDRRKALAARLD